jgi:hypothetical protein
MVEFNPNGSIKLPDGLAKKAEDNKNKMQRQRCIKITKDVVSFTAPKKCILHITLSESFSDNRFIHTTYDYFNQKAAVPTKIKQIGDREFQVEIGTDFRRCSDCSSLIGKYREFLDGNLIEEKGSCTFEGRQNSFSYEDYFD